MTQAQAYDNHITATDVIAAYESEQILKFFNFGHLPEGKLKETSMIFNKLAIEIIERIPRSPERTLALRKLLESKDCVVRAQL